MNVGLTKEELIVRFD